MYTKRFQLTSCGLESIESGLHGRGGVPPPKISGMEQFSLGIIMFHKTVSVSQEEGGGYGGVGWWVAGIPLVEL